MNKGSSFYRLLHCKKNKAWFYCCIELYASKIKFHKSSYTCSMFVVIKYFDVNCVYNISMHFYMKVRKRGTKVVKILNRYINAIHPIKLYLN
jgi:hypothetical protein